MSENNGWRTMDSAPSDKPVLCGKWDIWNERQEWRQTEGTPWRSRLWGLTRVRTYHGEEYSHWKDLPPPPETHTQEA